MVARGTTETIVAVGGDRAGGLWTEQLLKAAWPEPHRLVRVAEPREAVPYLLEEPGGFALVDLGARGVDRVEAVVELRSLAPGAAIIAFSDRDDEPEALSAIRAGAQDYLIKADVYPALLRRALRHARERARAESELAHRALHDPLTGLPNRALFLDRLGVALDRRRRSGAAVAVLFLDVDGFKEINDSLGHSAGDRVLAGLADRLRTMLRPMDTVCRYGGDEFTLLFEDLESEREVVLIAERINQAAALPIALAEGQIAVTVSIGVAVVADPNVGVETVIREADAAMYRAKRSGRSRFELSDERSRQRAMRRLELEHALERAIERGELSVHYQPQFSLDDGPRVTGLEALVRWRHPSDGLLAPAEFLELAEETGLIVPIGQHVLAEALRQVAQWRRLSPELTVSINFSRRQLEDPGLLSGLASTVHASAVPPRALCLELSERAIAEPVDAMLSATRALKAMGVALAIDDFGLGGAALGMLERFPFDAVKLHPSLVAGLGTGPRNRPIAGALVELGHALGLSVLAQGVETAAQLSELRALGCDGAQGFWLGHPVPEYDIPSLLAAGAGAPSGSSS